MGLEQSLLRTIMIKSKKITIVFQGQIDPSQLGSGATDGTDFLYNLAQTKKALPNAKVILSTWNSFEFPSYYNTAAKLGVDRLILNPDPGGLPNIKFGYDTPNNVNRQIASTAAGMALVNTKYALKLRADSFLTSDNLLSIYDDYVKAIKKAPQSDSQTLSPASKKASKKSKAGGAKKRKKNNKNYSPIAVASFFTIDPNVYEHMAFHVSDWVQFGKRKALQEYWSVKPMSEKNATYFESNHHDDDAAFFDNQFRTKLAVEQHIAVKYAKSRGYKVPTHYNHIDDDILKGYNRFLAEHFIVLDLEQFGLSFPKYGWVQGDDFMALNCVSHEDWYRMLSEHWQLKNPDQSLLDAADNRLALKRDNLARIAAEQVTMSLIYP